MVSMLDVALSVFQISHDAQRRHIAAYLAAAKPVLAGEAGSPIAVLAGPRQTGRTAALSIIAAEALVDGSGAAIAYIGSGARNCERFSCAVLSLIAEYNRRAGVGSRSERLSVTDAADGAIVLDYAIGESANWLCMLSGNVALPAGHTPTLMLIDNALPDAPMGFAKGVRAVVASLQAAHDSGVTA